MRASRLNTEERSTNRGPRYGRNNATTRAQAFNCFRSCPPSFSLLRSVSLSGASPPSPSLVSEFLSRNRKTTTLQSIVAPLRGIRRVRGRVIGPKRFNLLISPSYAVDCVNDAASRNANPDRRYHKD